MNSPDELFNKLNRRAEMLAREPARDSEAARHELLIVPLITSQFGLGWNHEELIPQVNLPLPLQLDKSHIFRGAKPISRKPDILISPIVDGEPVNKFVVAIEEKKRQKDITGLEENRLQILEYQALCRCPWGVLTDGERWIIKRNLETYAEFKSIDDFRKNLLDIQQCIGRLPLLDRVHKQGSSDFLIVRSGSPTFFDPGLTLTPAKINSGEISSLCNRWITNPDTVIFQEWLTIYPPHRLFLIQTELVARGELLNEVIFFSKWLELSPQTCATEHNLPIK